MSSAARRERLIEVAAPLFASLGFAETSLRGLADAAGCSRSSLHDEFATKDDLLAAVAEPFVEAIETMLVSFSLDLGVDEDRVSVIKAYLIVLGGHRDVAKVLLTDVAARRTAIGERVVELQRSTVARLTGPRAPLRQQVRARCALAICNLMVGELAGVQAHRLRPPLFEAAVDLLVTTKEASSGRGGAKLEARPRLPASDR